MRMTASWSGPNDPTEYKSVARRCAQSRAPLGSSTDRQTGTDQKPTLCKKPVSQFIVAPRAQASRRCETQATLARLSQLDPDLGNFADGLNGNWLIGLVRSRKNSGKAAAVPTK